MTVRLKKLVQIINHDAGTVAVEVHREEQLGNRWLPVDPTDWTGADLSEFTESFNAVAAARITELEEQVASLPSITAERDAALERIEELEAQLNPPNPFPNADWSGFRIAALSDPAVQRVAVGNPVIWPLLLMFLNELSTNPSRGTDIAMLWNMMESIVPVTTEEIDRVNDIAVAYGVPLQLNADGQIGAA